MTAIGGLGHALPFLIPNFWTATAIAFIVVFIELWAIAWIQNRYMETPFLRAAFQILPGGGVVLAVVVSLVVPERISDLRVQLALALPSAGTMRSKLAAMTRMKSPSTIVAPYFIMTKDSS